MFRPEKGAVALTLAIQIMDIHEILKLIRQGAYEFSMHAQQERLAEDLDVTEIEEALTLGEILEAYPHDLRGESCLIVGHAGIKPIHAVLGWAKSRGEGKRILRSLMTARAYPSLCDQTIIVRRRPSYLTMAIRAAGYGSSLSGGQTTKETAVDWSL
jgi:hypothetical protein